MLSLPVTVGCRVASHPHGDSDSLEDEIPVSSAGSVKAFA